MEDIRKDNEVLVIEKQVPDLTTKITSVVIKDELSSKYANDLALACKKLIDKAEEKRKFIVGPLNDHIKTINNEFKKITAPLMEGVAILKEKLLRWQQEIRKVKEAEQEEKLAVANDFLGDEAPAEIEKPKVRVESGMGMSFMRKVWAWKVIDEAKIPRGYLMIDEKKINAMVKAHTKNIHGVVTNDLSIDGIEIFQKDEVSLRG